MPYADPGHRRANTKTYYLKNRNRILCDQKEYRRKNRSYYLVYLRKYYKNNRNTFIEKASAWKQANRTRVNELARASYRRRSKSPRFRRRLVMNAQRYIRRHPEHVRLRRKAHYRKNRRTLIAAAVRWTKRLRKLQPVTARRRDQVYSARARARRYGEHGRFSLLQWVEQLRRQHWRCALCRKRRSLGFTISFRCATAAAM